MATDNQSPSYLKERAEARKILLNDQDAALYLETLKKNDVHGEGQLARLFNDDNWMDWAELVKDTKDCVAVAKSNMAAVNAIQVARQGNSNLRPPVDSAARWQKMASVPMPYYIRKIVETADPDYWNDPRNFLKEILNNPWFATVPLDVVRGEYEQYVGR